MADMKWAKVCMEGIVEKGIIDCEIHGASLFAARSRGIGSALARRLWLLSGVGKRGFRIGRVVVGSQVESICIVLRSVFMCLAIDLTGPLTKLEE
jgi:hypothetical protein